MNNFENWTEVSKGLYRYVIASNVCYEIHLYKHYHNQNILNASASLYLVGDWKDSTGSYFDRELLLSDKTVADCIDKAIEDNETNSIVE